MRFFLESHLLKFWYSSSPARYLLWPFSALFYGLSFLMRIYLQQRQQKINVPIIVVGNITVGGNGKTPVVIWLADYLKKQGLKPGIVSRGYKSKAKKYPYYVQPDSDPQLVGDEALLLAKRTACPVIIAPDRVAAVKALLATTACNIVISDDGLQHYALPRDIEIIIVDAEKLFGNGLLLPAGPLREPESRLAQAHFVLYHGNNNQFANARYFKLNLIPQALYNIANPQQQRPLTAFANQKLHAITGIGNPERFFNSLIQAGLTIIKHPFPDHYNFKASDFVPFTQTIIMTEKDAVKCAAFAAANFWCLPVVTELTPEFVAALTKKLQEIIAV